MDIIIDVELELNDTEISVDLINAYEILDSNAEEYKGSYEVTPRLEEQTLPTALKVMRNDVKIKEIPYAEVSNTSGGTTVIIG